MDTIAIPLPAISLNLLTTVQDNCFRVMGYNRINRLEKKKPQQLFHLEVSWNLTTVQDICRQKCEKGQKQAKRGKTGDSRVAGFVGRYRVHFLSRRDLS